MREINKVREPRLLAQYRSGGGIYDGPNFTPVKKDIKKSLLKEQGHLCAYCMARITAETMKVEHWACQQDNPELQLDYSNLLGCCKGSMGSKPIDQTCDTRKSNLALKFNPSRKQDHMETLIKFRGDGVIYSTDAEFSEQINSVLNLNKDRLVKNRFYLLESVRLKLSSKPGRRTAAEISRLLNEYIKYNARGQLKEYCGLVKYYLSH